MDNLRIETKILLVKKGMDARGLLPELASLLSERTGKTVRRTTLSMALTGYRTSNSYQRILQELHDMLEEMPENGNSCPDVFIAEAVFPIGCDTIHG